VNLKTVRTETESGEYQDEEFPAQLPKYQFAKKLRLIGLVDFNVKILINREVVTKPEGSSPQ
jgi:hypothetical protein